LRNPLDRMLAQDRAIRVYMAHYTDDSGHYSRDTYNYCLRAWRLFLSYSNQAITNTAVSDTIESKRRQPNDTTIETDLTLFAKSIKAGTHHAAAICGTFSRNHVRLGVTFHVKSDHKTTPIAEPLIRAVYNDPELDEDDRLLLDLFAYGMERRNALGELPIDRIRLTEHSAILDIPSQLNKKDFAHISIIPRTIAERLLARARANGYRVLYPEYASRMAGITKLAKAKHNVHLTAHYFRKRAETIAEKIPNDVMNMNHWLILEGVKPRFGHMPEIYSLNSDDELVAEYETYLAPKLSLTGEIPASKPTEIEQLRKQNAQLTEQILKLTALLTQKNW